MRNRISFVILSNSGLRIKQVNTSKMAIRLMAVFFFCGLISGGYVIYDYLRLKRTSFDLQKRETHVSRQLKSNLGEIENQRQQIQAFAKEITTLKNKLIILNDFEKKIRIIANVNKADESENLFGVGGSIPEDLDAQIPLKEKHNGLMREMHEQIKQLKTASTSQEEGFEALLKSLEDQQNLLASTPTVRPIDSQVKSWRSSSFGYRKSPFTGRREFHRGYDISAPEGTPVLATADGVVTFAGKKGLLGETVVIDHGHGVITRYGHCSKILKKRGEKVKRWDAIALVGNTGRSTGPHVHYEVRLNGVPVNPNKYIID
ncbi:MAG: M23 family metallopeptidase [Desulfobacterales bacterium]|nr:MAG: M23 family metallopeptidase [Desulfobacterales bacterium]